ncbi:MAG: hypothetical protein V9F04_00635, partial [Dermatophilaceae bacterium]
LSLIIPLGLFGLISFLWFLAAAFRVLRYNYRYGDAEYRRINTFLLAYFTVRVLFFFVIFGSFHTELTIFTGLIGLSISLNGGMCRPAPAHALAPTPLICLSACPKWSRPELEVGFGLPRHAVRPTLWFAWNNANAHA